MITTPLLFALGIGICIGLIMGLTGAGGGVLAVPALVYSQNWSMQQAMPVALFAVSLGAFVGTIDGLRHNQVRYRASFLMAIVGAPFTSLGILVAQNLSQRVLLLTMSMILLIVATRQIGSILARLNDLSEVEFKPDALASVNRQTGRFDWNTKTFGVISLIGASAGFFSGLLGVGGGFVIFPLLQYFSNLSVQSIAATSMMVITLVGSAAITSAILHGAELPLAFSLVFAFASIAGVLLGGRLADFIPHIAIQVIFMVVLFFVSSSLLMRAL